MHQILQTSLVIKEYVLVHIILLLMPITDVFLRHDVQKKLEEFNSHVRVLDSSVHDYTHAAGKLQVEI